MSESKLMIAARKKNGQLGYLSEGYSIPEFFSLIRPINNINVLMDFSPLIDVLHKLHHQTGNRALLASYNDLHNFWRESKSYRKESILMARAEKVSEKSSALIAELQIRVGDRYPAFYDKNIDEIQSYVLELKADCDIYINTLLYYIHAKAVLEVESFARDSVLVEHGKFLEDVIRKTYDSLMSISRHGEQFITFMAFERPEEALYFLALEGKYASLDELKLNALAQCTSRTVWDDYFGNQQIISLSYASFSDKFINIAIMLRNLLYKAQSVNHLIDKLKGEGIQWDDSVESIQAVTDEISIAGGRNHLGLGY